MESAYPFYAVEVAVIIKYEHTAIFNEFILKIPYMK